MVISSSEKLIGPYQNFLYVIQNYKILPDAFEVLCARAFPWMELFIGVFLVLGLWTKWTLRAALIMFLAFILVVGQALIRHLDITECGCFGGLISIPPHKIIILDSLLLSVVGVMLCRLERAGNFSLDRYFEKHL